LAHLVVLLGWLAGLLLVAWWAWSIETGPVHVDRPETVVGAGLRVLVVGIAGWLAGGTVLVTASALLGHDGAVRALMAVTPRFVTHLARGVAAASVSTALLAGVTVAGVAAQDPAPVTQLQATLSLVDPEPVPALEATLELVVPEGRPDRVDELGPIRGRAETAPDVATPVSPTPPPPQQRDWIVQPGESFWAKAEQMRGSVSEAAVIDYWLALIDANRERLVRPGDPDLILPGQVFVLPSQGP
jgi:hypothetical protein